MDVAPRARAVRLRPGRGERGPGLLRRRAAPRRRHGRGRGLAPAGRRRRRRCSTRSTAASAPTARCAPTSPRPRGESVERLLAAKPVVVGIGRALDVVPGMRRDLVLHAGPPVEWERMSGPTRGAVMGGLVYEGLARTPEEAAAMAAAGRVAFEPCHHHAAVGPMAGVVTASMPVWIVENTGLRQPRATATLNEGLGKVLRYGAYDDEVLTRLRWMEKTLAPALARALAAHGPLDLRSLIAQALQMGDEVHNRNRAATSLLIRALAPHLVRTGTDADETAAVLRFLDGNDHFFLNLSMAGGQVLARPGRRHPRLEPGQRHGAQRHRLRHPGRGPAGALVHRAGADGGRALPAGLHRGGRRARHRRLGHHRDRRAGRHGHGRGAGHRAVRRRQRGAGAGLHAPHVRHHAGRAPGLPDPGARLPRHGDRHRPAQGGRERRRARRQHRHRPPSSPASAWSAPDW